MEEFDFREGAFEQHDKPLKGNNDLLSITRPEIIKDIHRQYLQAGADIIETNTFSGTTIAQADYGLEDAVYTINYESAKIAKEVCDEFTDRTRFVAGSIGPTNRTASISPDVNDPGFRAVSFDDLVLAYKQQVNALIDGGVDLLLVETIFDTLNAKAALYAIDEVFEERKIKLPIMVSGTITDQSGRTLTGQTTEAFLISLSHMPLLSIGLNCALGASMMRPYLQILNEKSTFAVSAHPNAGLPNEFGQYEESPQMMANQIKTFLDESLVNIIGGCCGTTPAHMKAVVAKLDGHKIVSRNVAKEIGASSLYQFVPFRQDLAYMAIGERANANGSRAFRDALLIEDWQSCIEIARDQIRDGAHMLDLSVDYVGRDGVADMKELAFRFATTSTLPIVLDSTEPAVLEAGLKQLGGRSVINSVNYEDGDGPKSRFARIMPLVKEHGAAVIALTIDEDGQARDAQWKLKVSRRLINDLTANWGMRVDDILIDCLTFPIATGQEETRRDGIETLNAIKALKEEFPNVQTTLGVSNVSFGLNPAARIVLNSVFLAEAVKNGLDSAIVHPSKITPINRIPAEQLKVALDLVYDRREIDANGDVIYDPLTKFLQLFENVEVTSTKESRAAELAALPLNERLQRRIIDGEKVGLSEDLQSALDLKIPALEIINDYLLSGMKTVGELFGKGEMQLPFVLQSAEVMKTAVAYLEPFIEKTDDQGRGKILLATVKGDVHDIGKNLVDIILSNNGYETVNIGIKQTVNQIIDAATENNVDVIGMSGLLVKSTVIMKENLQELDSRGLGKKWPVVLGGAALTRSFVEQDLSEQFSGTVRYAKDAFEGLKLMDTLMGIKRGVVGCSHCEACVGVGRFGASFFGNRGGPIFARIGGLRNPQVIGRQ